MEPTLGLNLDGFVEVNCQEVKMLQEQLLHENELIILF